MPQHILAADIGGTNSRFGHFSLTQGTLRLEAVYRCPTTALCGAQQAGTLPPELPTALGLRLHDTFAACTDMPAPNASVWAAAGPVQHGNCPLSNAPLTLRAAQLQALLWGEEIRPLALINDFAAQAWACLSPAVECSLPLLPAAPHDAHGAERSTIGVIGAGTGLGMAQIIPTASGWQAVSSEAGHIPFAFVDEDERDFAAFMRHECGRQEITAEDILSGRGLEQLHRFLTGDALSAVEISATVLRDTPAEETSNLPPTARLFARFYGRVCRQWILTSRCTGGLFVSGGVATQNPVLVRCADFAAALRPAPAVAHYPVWVRSVPVALLTAPYSGLWGAARAAQALLAK